MNALHQGLCGVYDKVERINFASLFSDRGILGTERYIQKFVQEHKIDLVISAFFATNFELSVEFYNSLRRTTYIVFCFYDDALYFDVASKYYAQAADLVLTSERWVVESYGRFGIRASYNLLPEWNSQDFRPRHVKKDIDVGFVGNCRKRDRMEYIQFLIDHGIRVETFGLGSKHGFISNAQLPVVLARTKISLNFTKTDSLDWLNGDEPLVLTTRQTKGRPFLCAFVKSCCLSEYAPGLEVLFRENNEILFFHTKDELLRKITYFLEHEQVRQEIENNAYARAISNYDADLCFRNTATQIEEALRSVRKSVNDDSALYLSSTFKAKRVVGLSIWIYYFIKRLKIRKALDLGIYLLKLHPIHLIRGLCYWGWQRAGVIYEAVCTKARDSHSRSV